LPIEETGVIETLKRGGGKMKKYMITITALLENETSPTLVLDISPDSVLVNCPKNSGIEVEALKGESHVDLICKLPDTEEKLHFHCPNLQRLDEPRAIAFG
jgi:hypothetical protein